jgi:hypothetical protein
VTHLAAAHPLSDSLTQEIITQLVLVKLDVMRHDVLGALVLLFTAQTRILGHAPKFNSFVVTKLADMENFPETLAQIQSKNQVGNSKVREDEVDFHKKLFQTINLVPFLTPLFEAALDDCKKEKQFSTKKVDKMILKIFECLFLPSDQAGKIIK